MRILFLCMTNTTDNLNDGDYYLSQTIAALFTHECTMVEKKY